MKTDNGPRVLVVDDEPSIVDAVATSLRYEGFTVDEALTGRKALAQAQEDPPDLLILDVMLPDLDGLEVTRRLRTDGVRVPVLFLTARDTLQDKLAGLTVGGDDYVTKPFALAEVIARVHAILRRTGYEAEDDGILRFADLELDESAHEVRRAGNAINLTATSVMNNVCRVPFWSVNGWAWMRTLLAPGYLTARTRKSGPPGSLELAVKYATWVPSDCVLNPLIGDGNWGLYEWEPT